MSGEDVCPGLPRDDARDFSMSLRDWFAGQAITRPDVRDASEAYYWADEMIRYKQSDWQTK